MIPPKNTENKNEQKDPNSMLITYTLYGNKAIFLYDINKQTDTDDNGLTINIKDITCKELSQRKKLNNKEEYHNGNGSAPGTDILTEKRMQGNKRKPNDINTIGIRKPGT
jgi:hypothetical protein